MFEKNVLVVTENTDWYFDCHTKVMFQFKYKTFSLKQLV